MSFYDVVDAVDAAAPRGVSRRNRTRWGVSEASRLATRSAFRCRVVDVGLTGGGRHQIVVSLDPSTCGLQTNRTT